MNIDLTERKQMEAEREKLEIQNRQLQKAESLSRMAGAIAHHFNNQLMVVMGSLEMVMETPPLSDRDLPNLVQAMKAARRAAEVGRLMLTYLGQTTAKKVSMNVSELCRRNLPLLRAALPETVGLVTDFSFSVPTIEGNANQIQQALTNLITNAGEACRIGDSVSLSVKTVPAGNIPESHRYPINWQPENQHYTCLEVADSGHGIEEKDIEKIFDPFFTRKFIGRGLGLAVTLGIIRGHDGAITVESTPGRGSIFRVFLPVADKRPSACDRENDHMPLTIAAAKQTIP